jgi:hypothetical protein
MTATPAQREARPAPGMRPRDRIIGLSTYVDGNHVVANAPYDGRGWGKPVLVVSPPFV